MIIKQLGANMREKELAKVISQECIGTGVYSMWIETKAAQTAVAGQFISVYCKDKTKLLPRPISICQIDKEKGRLRIVYRVVGGGTEEMYYIVRGMIFHLSDHLAMDLCKEKEKRLY